MDGYVTIGTKIDTTGIDSGLKNINNTMNKGMTSLQNSVNKTFSLIKNSIIGAGIILAIRAITKELGNAVTRLDTMKNYVNVMSNLGIGSKEAKESIERLSEELKGLPTTLDSAALSVQRLASSNRNIKASTEMYLALNNAILAGGASTQIQASAMEQLSQAYAKGKPDMMEWRTAMMAMPAQLQQVANVMGFVSADALGESLRNGTTSMNDFMITLVKMNREGLNGFKSLQEQARNSTGGIQTSIENVKTAITRGLANIMDAIGRSNIAGFFDGIRNAIDAVIPKIQAFVKLIMTAVSFILSLFGKKLKTETEKETESMDSFGASVGDATEQMDGASGSAGKLYKELKQLAGFDEMNVLQDNKSSSGGSGGGGGSAGGGVDMSNIDFDFGTFDKVSNKMDEIYQKMLKWAKWFTEDMDFQPLVNSINHLGKALIYLRSGMGDWMNGFITNFIKPLATYTINEFLPHFLESTASAIEKIDFNKINTAFNNLWKVLEPFAENVGDGLLWFYDNVLIPLGLWTINDVLPAFLNLLTGALDFLNTMINDLKPAWDWFYQNFLKPLAEFTGGIIVDVINALATALKKIADNKIAMTIIETIFSVAVVSAITTMLAPLIALKGIFDLIGVALKTVEQRFNEVKAVVQPVVDKIKEAFEPVADFFKSVFGTAFDNIKKIFDNIKIIAQFLWDKIKEIFKPVGDWFKQKFDDAKEKIKKVFEPLINFFSQFWDRIKNKLSEFGAKVGEAVGGAFKRVINGVLGAIESILNTPIRAINSLIGVLKKVPGLGGLSKLSTFSLPRLATGAIINQPGRGVPVGVAGEAGREGIIPLTDDRAMAELGREIGKHIVIPLTVPVSIGNRQIARIVKDLMADDDFAMNN